MKRFLIILLCLLPCICTRAQGDDADWSYDTHFNFGFNVYFFSGHGQKFPGWKAFAGASFAAVNKHNYLFNYGPTLSFYSKSLGANLSPLVDDVQIDFAHSLSAGGWWGDAPGYTKYLRTLGNSAAYNMVLRERNAAFLSTIFVFNNHRRNQALGAITGTFGDFTISYYNDGGAPIEWGSFSDHLDRYWTGGIGFFFHNNSSFNNVEFLFDQFTGYAPMLYEMSSILGIRLPDYNLDNADAKEGKTPGNFNTSAYNLRWFPYRNYAVDIGVIGSLRSKNDDHAFGLQDIIHTIGRYPLHPNNDANRFYLGGTYLNINMHSFSLLFLAFLLGGLWGCKTAKAPFTLSRCDSPEFYRQALGWGPGTHKDFHVVIYNTDFNEQKVESGNVLISPSLNRYTNREKADYDNKRRGYKQVLYLVRLDGGSLARDTFVYFSVLYKAGVQRGFSRAYVGTSYIPSSIYFHLELYMAEEGGSLVLKPKKGALSRKADSTHLLFVADSLRPEGDIIFTRIVDREDNKFGGADPYVFEVRKHFTDLPEGLRFHRLSD